MSSDTSQSGKNEKRGVRPTIYMSRALERELEAQASSDDMTKSSLVAELLELLLMSETGRELRQSAQENQQTLTQELAKNLIVAHKDVPRQQIAQLARESQRSPEHMLVHLILLGLEVYERRVARLARLEQLEAEEQS